MLFCMFWCVLMVLGCVCLVLLVFVWWGFGRFLVFCWWFVGGCAKLLVGFGTLKNPHLLGGAGKVLFLCCGGCL